MNTEDQNQDFARLQQLLKLKRYETPPPRYFNDFSAKVVSRIRAGRTGDRYDAFENLVTQTPWLNRLWRVIERQPAVSGAVAVIAGCLMVAGVFVKGTTSPQGGNFTGVTESNRDHNVAGNSAGNNFAVGSNLAVAASAAASIASSTSTLSGPNLFEHLPSLQVMPVSGVPSWQRAQSNLPPPFFR